MGSAKKTRQRRPTTLSSALKGAELAMPPAVAVVASTVDPHGFAVAMLAFLPGLVSLAVAGQAGLAKWRIERWYQALCEDTEKPFEDVVAEVEEKAKSSPEVRDVILQSVQRLLEASEAAVPILAAVARDYVRGPRSKVDRFFRGFTRVVAELSAEELADLANLVYALATSPAALRAIERERLGAERLGIRIEDAQGVFDLHDTSHPLAGKREVSLLESSATEADRCEPLTQPTDPERLFQLLKLHGLGRDTATGGFVGRGGPRVLRLPMTNASKMRRYLPQATK